MTWRGRIEEVEVTALSEEDLSYNIIILRCYESNNSARIITAYLLMDVLMSSDLEFQLQIPKIVL